MGANSSLGQWGAVTRNAFDPSSSDLDLSMHNVIFENEDSLSNLFVSKFTGCFDCDSIAI